MKIIDLGICVDNNDPKGIGRIRVQRYADYFSGKDNMYPNGYEEWDDKDPFLATPFLPVNISMVPEVKQVVKIINYNTEKETVNQEYIAGPFTSAFDINSQTFSQQVEDTTYGIPMKERPKIIGENQTYINKKSKNVFAKYRDYAIYGKYGSDTIFTENGLVLRGGKLLSKEFASDQERTIMNKFPLMANKCAKLQLKKFGKTLIKKEEQKIEREVKVTDLNFIIEYTIDDIETPTKIEFYLYQVNASKTNVYKTNFFDEHTIKPEGTYKLINVEENETSPSFVINLINDPLYQQLKNKNQYISSKIRLKLQLLRTKGVAAFNETYEQKFFSNTSITTKDIHPFYFRPTDEFLKRTYDNEDLMKIKLNLLTNIKLTSEGPIQSGLVWSRNTIKPESIQKDVRVPVTKENKNSEQTFGSITSDKIYLLSTSPNQASKIVNFNDLDSYEYTHEDYIDRVDPNTYSMVRGENLINFLYTLIDVLLMHEHNLVGPMVKVGFEPYDRLYNLIRTIEEDVLNKSIRLN